MRECFLFSVASELLRLVLCSYEVDSWFTPDIIRSSAMSGFSLRFLRESIFQRLYDNRIGRYLRFSSLVKGKNRPSHSFCQLSLFIPLLATTELLMMVVLVTSAILLCSLFAVSFSVLSVGWDVCLLCGSLLVVWTIIGSVTIQRTKWCVKYLHLDSDNG